MNNTIVVVLYKLWVFTWVNNMIFNKISNNINEDNFHDFSCHITIRQNPNVIGSFRFILSFPVFCPVISFYAA